MNRKRTSGFTLLEVLIAVLVLSLGILGVGAALVTAQRSASSSYLAQQSAQLAQNIIERMRQNPTGAESFSYNLNYTGGAVAAPSTSCTGGSACTAQQQAAYDLWQWQNSLNAALPGANASVTVTLTGAGTYDALVLVSYDDTSASTALKFATTRRSVQLETLL